MRFIFFILGVSLVAYQSVTGLEMFENLDVKVLPGDKSTCAVLHCIEKGEEPRLSSITELTVFKSSPGAGDRSRRSVASLSARHPSVSTMWDGIKVDGSWSKKLARLTLYLVERDDCRSAQFSCEVRYMNGLNEERVGFAQLGKANVDPATSHSRLEDSCNVPTASFLHLSAFFQQSNSVNQLQSRLEDKIRDLQNHLQDKISALDTSFARHTRGDVKPHAQDKLDQSLASLNALSDRLLGIAERAVATIKDTPRPVEGANLIQRTSCERRESNYQIVVPLQGEAPYLCDTHTTGGGWIVIQRRSTGNVDFYKNWSAYKKGFGSLADDFWLGNDRIHSLTSQGPYELLVSLKYGNISAIAHYQTFSIGDEASQYVLHLGAYDGSAGDSLSGHKNMPFSTYDKDNDKHETTNCAVSFRGGWWYKKCYASNLNGEWGALNSRGPRWSGLSGSDPVTYSEMKIRRL